MKNQWFPLILCIILCAQGAQASTVLATWDEWQGAVAPSQIDADFAVTGFDASITYASNRVNAGYGSKDGSFGSLNGASTSAGGLLVRARNSGQAPGGPELALRLTNDTASAYRLDSLHFDFSARNRPSKPDEHGFTGFDVVYNAGGLSDAATLIESAADLVLHDGGKAYDYSDFDIILSEQLADTVLEVGQSAMFLITFKGESDADVSSGLDNLAVTGSKVDIPEPSSCVLFGGVLSFACVAIRRRRAF